MECRVLWHADHPDGKTWDYTILCVGGLHLFLDTRGSITSLESWGEDSMRWYPPYPDDEPADHLVDYSQPCTCNDRRELPKFLEAEVGRLLGR